MFIPDEVGLRSLVDDMYRENASRTGIITAASISRLNLVDRFVSERGWEGAVGPRATAIRGLGPAMTPDQRKACGAPGRMKLGQDFWDALTDKGREDPKAASEALAYWPRHALQLQQHLQLVQHDRCDARMRIDTRHSCAASTVYDQCIVREQAIPDLPLPECDRWKCTCSFERYASQASRVSSSGSKGNRRSSSLFSSILNQILKGVLRGLFK